MIVALLASLVTAGLVLGIFYLNAHIRGMSAFSWGAIAIGIVIGALVRDGLLSWSWSKVKRDLRQIRDPSIALFRIGYALRDCVPCDPDQCPHGEHHCADHIFTETMQHMKGSPLMKNDKVTQLFRVESCTKNPKGEMLVAMVDAEDDGNGSLTTLFPGTVFPDLKVGDKISVYFDREDSTA